MFCSCAVAAGGARDPKDPREPNPDMDLLNMEDVVLHTLVRSYDMEHDHRTSWVASMVDAGVEATRPFHRIGGRSLQKGTAWLPGP